MGAGKMNKYTVIVGESHEELSEEVTKRLNAPGWFLVGGLVVSQNQTTFTRQYYQAMVYDEGQLKRHVQQVARPK